MSKCYLYTDKGIEYDLSPLMKLDGGFHRVEVAPNGDNVKSDMDFFLNICSETDACAQQGATFCYKKRVLDDLHQQEMCANRS